MAGQHSATKGKVRLEFEAIKPGRLVLEQEIGEGTTLKTLLAELAKTHRKVVGLVFDAKSQELTGVMAIVLNGNLIQAFDGLETKLKDGDVIAFVPIIDGG